MTKLDTNTSKDIKREKLIKKAYTIIQNIPNTSIESQERLKKDITLLQNQKIQSWCTLQKNQKSNVIATNESPNVAQTTKYDIPLKELLIGKAGIGDLYNKINEITRLFNDTLVHQNITKKDLE